MRVERSFSKSVNRVIDPVSPVEILLCTRAIQSQLTRTNKKGLIRSMGTSRNNSPLDQARALGQRYDWTGAFEILLEAERQGNLSAESLEYLAECARWSGAGDRVLEFFERAYHAYEPGSRDALRMALNLCYTHMDACQSTQAATWWKCADKLITDLPEGPEHGLHTWFSGRACGEEGDLEGHARCAQRAFEIAQRYGDRNVEALAMIDLGLVASAQGRSTDALAKLDHATELALGGELGVLETGIVYCNAIIASRSRGDWDRAQEWTDSASRWVSRTQVSYFPGLCRVHRAEMLRIRGELAAAESEAMEAVRLLGKAIPRWVAVGYNELGEIRRRRGDLVGALEAFSGALGAGWEPQPSFSLVVLAQGDPRSAHQALVRFCRNRTRTLQCEDRSSLLTAKCHVAIAAGDIAAAAASVIELSKLASDDALTWDQAAYATACGQLALARGDSEAAVDELHRARAIWGGLDAPYELAKCCLDLGRALFAESDSLGAKLEFETAHGIFERIGATYDRDQSRHWLDENASQSAPVEEPGSSSHLAASLQRQGDFWEMSFNGSILKIKNNKGIGYIARLLAEPGQETLATELAGYREAATLTEDFGEQVDAKSRQSYRNRLIDLQEQLDEATAHNDLGTIERCRSEMEALTQQLSAAFGLGGRARRAGAPIERARQSVTKAIRSTLRKIAEEDEYLGRYLSNTIRTGFTCQFEPDPAQPSEWKIET